jgi:hypothetical protein
MLAALARGTDGNFFPLFRNTAFKITFARVNKHHTVGSHWCPKAAVIGQKSLQNIRIIS